MMQDSFCLDYPRLKKYLSKKFGERQCRRTACRTSRDSVIFLILRRITGWSKWDGGMPQKLVNPFLFPPKEADGYFKPTK